MSAPSKAPNPFAHHSLAELQDACVKALAHYRRKHDPHTDTSACLEIVRRASTGDPLALEAFSQLVQPLVSAKCPPDLKEELSDIQQEVVLRLWRSLQRGAHFATFAKFRKFLALTTHSVVSNFRRAQQHFFGGQNIPLEVLTEAEKEAIPQISVEAQVEQLLALEALLQQLAPLEREIFRLRFFIGLKPAAIAQRLSPLYPQLSDAAAVSSQLENIIRRLRRGQRF